MGQAESLCVGDVRRFLFLFFYQAVTDQLSGSGDPNRNLNTDGFFWISFVMSEGDAYMWC